MADIASFARFVDFVLRVDEAFHDHSDVNRVPKRRLRDRLNPLEHFSDREFLSRYRFTKETVGYILTSLPLEPNTDNRGLPLSPMLQLLIALRFFGAGTFQVVAGDLVNVSQPTVCRVVERISRLIASSLFASVVKFPQAASGFDVAMRKFYEVASFPGVTGCIDCTHVRMNNPGGPSSEVYRNRKGYFSINVQVITGPQLQFYDAVVGWPGSVHDSRIFDNSRARVLYETRRVPGLLLGDAGYACGSFLMTPLPNPGAPNSPESRYQAAHIRTRNTVERAFGVWKRRFPCLDMRLQHKLENTVVITTACAALHNIACMRNEPCPPAVPTPAVQLPRGTRQQQPHLPVPAPVDSINGSRARARLIARCFQ